MTTDHPGAPTKPLELGAPLPPGTNLHVLSEDLTDEIRRAEVEFIYALARHRKAWAAMRAHAEHRDALIGKPGGLAAIEADPVWKKRTGDVSWWRDEMNAQANAILALKALLNDRAAAKERRDRDRKPTLRATVMGWDPGLPPTEVQANAARAWKQAAGGSPADSGRCAELLDAHYSELVRLGKAMVE